MSSLEENRLMTMALTLNHDQLVEMDKNIKNTFYPGILLLDYLRESQYLQRNKHVGPMLQSSFSLEDQFHDFVCKLALLCQTMPHGDSVSACVVLQRVEGGVKYVFASNNRDTQELEEARVQLKSLLRMLRRSPTPETEPEKPEELRRSILRKALRLQVWRIKSYLRAFLENLTACIRACVNDPEKNASVLREYLNSLRDCAVRALEEGDDEESDNLPIKSINSVEVIIARLAEFGQLRIQSMIRPRLVREENLGSTTNWYEIGHVAARLLAYERAVDAFLTARETWPELFEAPEVDFIPSSTPMEHPLSPEPLAPEQIIQKIANAEDKPRLILAIKSFHKFQSSNEVKDKWRKHFKPVVHAEVLLHDWLEKTEGGTHSERFFRRYKFIGTSKPPCRLCSFYFDELGTDVKVQPSHRNLYLSWRPPDVYLSQGPGPLVRRRKIMHGMKERICTDIIQAMGAKLSDGRPHDSSSNSTYIVSQAGSRDGLAISNHAALGMNSVNHDDPLHRMATLTPIPEQWVSSLSNDWNTNDMENEEQDEDSDGLETLKLEELSRKDDELRTDSDIGQLGLEGLSQEDEEPRIDSDVVEALQPRGLGEEDDIVLFRGRRSRVI